MKWPTAMTIMNTVRTVHFWWTPKTDEMANGDYDNDDGQDCSFLVGQKMPSG